MEKITYKLTDFEGPLDLLIALIEKNKYNILDIPIAKLCDQYLEFLAEAEAMNMEIATEFLNMASQLMVWKSRMLIPHEEEEEKGPRFDPSDIIIRHQHAKEAAGKMHPLFAYFSNRMVKDTDEIAPDKTFVEDQNPESLCTAMRRVLAYRENMETAKTKFTPMISKPIVPVEGKIVMILQTLEQYGTATLRELLVNAPSLADLIASFMGVLELIKVRKILMEDADDVDGDDNTVRGENTRFFINPDAPNEEPDIDADFSTPPDEAQATDTNHRGRS